MIMWFLDHQLFSFVVGVFFGAFVIDLAISMYLGTILSKKAKEFDKKSAVDFAKIQEKLRGKKFFSVYNPRSLSEKLEDFESFIKRSPDKIN